MQDREILPSDMRVLYLIGEVDSYEDDKPIVTCQISQQQSLNNLFANASNYDESLFEESLPSNYISPSPEPMPSISISRPQPPKLLKQKRANRALHERLMLCRIEREKAKTELINAQRRLVEAQLRNLDKNGNGVDLLLSLGSSFKN
jgi:hypothetical protein